MTSVSAHAPDARPTGTGGLLAVHAHPDDETLSTGALLATWAASGRPVTVVTCTRGECGEVIPVGLADLADHPARLAAHRALELAAALAALTGSTEADHLFLDEVPGPRGAALGGSTRRFVDSGMVWVAPGQAGTAPGVPDDAFVAVPVDDAAERLAEVIRDRRPEVVVGYEPGGGYGHPDHVHAHRVMRRGVELAARPGPASYRVPAVLWAAVDVDALSAARGELRRSGELGVADPDGPVPSAALPSEAIDVRVDVLPVLGRVEAALRAHATQVQGVRTWPGSGGPAGVGCFALSDAQLQPLLRWECYRCDPEWTSAQVGWPAGVLPGIA